MLLKFKASVVKESLLLLRDKAGLAMLFIMPMALVLLMTLLQDQTIKMLDEGRTPILVINYDADTFGNSVLEGLQQADFFDVHTDLDDEVLTDDELRKQVLAGKFRVGVIIHKGASEALRNKIKLEIQEQFPADEESLFDIEPGTGIELPRVDLLFDPAVKNDFKNAMTSALREFSYAVEAKMIFEIYAELIQDIAGIVLKQNEGFQDIIDFREEYARDRESRMVPNSVQHNVPAWTIFAMFFIVIPLAGNIIKERESGLAMRLKTMPGSNLPVILGKAFVYFIVGIFQAILMLMIGLFVLPLFGTPALIIGSGILPLILITIAVSLAASGYGILIGTIATTQEQSSIFGSISVVILAALGGIWVPTFIMSEMMLKVSRFSPLNWGLNGYYEVFLRNAGVNEVLGYITLLILFFISCIGLAYFYNKYKKSLS